MGHRCTQINGLVRYNSAVGRRMFGIISVISLLLFVGTCVLWVRGNFKSDTVYLDRTRSGLNLLSIRGAVGLAWWWYPFREDASPELEWSFEHSEPRSRDELLSGVQTSRQIAGVVIVSAAVHTTVHGVIIPDWMLAAAFLVCPVLFFWRRRFHQIPPNACRICGYDLRATPERCPECGAIPKEAAAP